MKSYLFAFLFSLVSFLSFSQEVNYTESELAINQHVDGTLMLPNGVSKPNIAIIIAGSGPTDRDGNQNFMKTNALKKLAIGLAKQNIASFRYDKRIVKQIREKNIDENILFDDFVTDAKSVLIYFKNREDFNKVYCIGHSQGSLVAMLALQEFGADGLISLAGAGQPIDQVILDQINTTAPIFYEDSKRVLDSLRNGKTNPDFPLALASLFNMGVQPFMINWIQYDPRKIIKDLNMPILIINGTKDLQVSEKEAQALHEANPNSQLVILDNMNHVLVPIEGDNLENSKSYNESQRALHEDLIPTLADFINQ